MSEQSDLRDRRRLAVRYMLCAIASTVLIQLQPLVTELVRREVLLTNIVVTIVIATPFISILVAIVVRWFSACQKAVGDPNPDVRHHAIDAALALPLRATVIYVIAWMVGMPLGMIATHLIEPMSTGDLVAYMTAWAGLIPVSGFPIYAVVEWHTRPVLKKLFDDPEMTRAEWNRLGGFSIARRVLLAIGSLVWSAFAFLSARPLAAEMGATDETAELDAILFELPIMMGFTLMVGMAVVYSLRGSISEVTSTVRSAADGDLTRRAAVTTTDELGALMLDIDRMLANQSGLIGSAKDVAREVTMSASAVADGSDQSAQGVAEIAHAMQEVVSGAQVQFEQISEARRSVDALSDAIEQATVATVRATEISADARELADEGSESAGQARTAMEEMQDTITEATRAVDRLGGDTADIGTIVDSIVTIADQTNLLALNAAIEAARAGEAGRGFAVVAEEVRQLASESNDAAAKIADLIKNIKRTVTDTVDAVNQGSAKVIRGVSVVDAAGAKFGDIAGALQTIGTQVGEINSRTEDVAGATDAVSEAVEKILAVTESVAALAQQTSANTEEASASSEEMSSSAEALRSMARRLESRIEAFRV